MHVDTEKEGDMQPWEFLYERGVASEILSGFPLKDVDMQSVLLWHTSE